MLIYSNKSISPTNQSSQDTVFKTIIGGFHYQIDNEILFHFQFVKQFNFSFTLLGIIGNLICIFIFKHKSLLKQKFNWYLLFQALTDLIFLTIIFITSMLKLVYDQEFVLQDVCWLLCLLTDYIFESLNALGVILTLVLSIDRLYAIMRPMKIRSFITYRRPKLIALILYLAILAIKSLEIILNQPKYDPIAPFGRRCNWSIGPNDFNKKLLYVLDSRILIPTVLIVIPALISFSLNLILWCYMRRYARKPLQASIDKNQNRSLLAHNRSSSDPAVNKTTTPNQQLSASNDVIVTAKNKRSKSAKTSYHLTIVMLNIMDLPYYCFHMYFVGRAIFKWKSFKMETTGPVTENISDILFCFFLLGHSINLVIYLLFHKEFQANALRIIHKLNPFGRKNRSLSRSSDQNNTPPPKAKSSQSTDTFHHRHSELNELSSKNRKSVISSYSMSSKSIRRSKS